MAKGRGGSKVILPAFEKPTVPNNHSQPEKTKTLELHGQSFQQLRTKVKVLVMTVKAVKTARKLAKNNGFSERRLGVMQTHRKREEQPSYARLLLRFRLIGKHSDLLQAWGVWQQVCADPVVTKLSMTLAAKKEHVHLVSVAEPFKNCARVLNSMSERQIAALKQRLGVPCVTR